MASATIERDGRYIPAGINTMVVTTPGLRVNARTLAEVLSDGDGAKADETTSKIRGGLKVESFRMPGHSESNFTFAADALDIFIRETFKDPESARTLSEYPIRSIYSATESAIDKSRPDIMVSIGIVQSKLLEDDEVLYRPVVSDIRHSRIVEMKFACVAGLLALDDAVTRVSRNAMLGYKESSVVVAMDTAIYDDKRAPNAEATQGAAAVLMWVTPNPALIEVHPEVGAHNITFSDFTKVGCDTPWVHGKPSEKIFVYNIGSAFEALEARLGASAKAIEFLICHVPFPKQAEYLAGFQFSHYLKTRQPALFEAITSRESVGREPITSVARLTNLIGNKFRDFNSALLSPSEEKEIITHIGSDPEITEYWKWLARLRTTPEFEEYKKSLHISEAVEVPKTLGNSYTGSVFVSLYSYLVNRYAKMSEQRPQKGALLGYGSGALAEAVPITIVATQEAIRKHTFVNIEMKDEFALDPAQYIELHAAHLTGDAQRLVTSDNLIEKDRALLRTRALSKGYHVVNMNMDGTGSYAYSDGIEVKPVVRRY